MKTDDADDMFSEKFSTFETSQKYFNSRCRTVFYIPGVSRPDSCIRIFEKITDDGILIFSREDPADSSTSSDENDAKQKTWYTKDLPQSLKFVPKQRINTERRHFESLSPFSSKTSSGLLMKSDDCGAFDKVIDVNIYAENESLRGSQLEEHSTNEKDLSMAADELSHMCGTVRKNEVYSRDRHILGSQMQLGSHGSGGDKKISKSESPKSTTPNSLTSYKLPKTSETTHGIRTQPPHSDITLDSQNLSSFEHGCHSEDVDNCKLNGFRKSFAFSSQSNLNDDCNCQLQNIECAFSHLNLNSPVSEKVGIENSLSGRSIPEEFYTGEVIPTTAYGKHYKSKVCPFVAVEHFKSSYTNDKENYCLQETSFIEPHGKNTKSPLRQHTDNCAQPAESELFIHHAEKTSVSTGECLSQPAYSEIGSKCLNVIQDLETCKHGHYSTLNDDNADSCQLEYLQKQVQIEEEKEADEEMIDAITLVHTMLNGERKCVQLNPADSPLMVKYYPPPKEATQVCWSGVVTQNQSWTHSPAHKPLNRKSILHMRSEDRPFPFSNESPSPIIITRKRFAKIPAVFF